MILFCDRMISEIKSASTETELKEIVDNSFSRLRAINNSYNEASYVVRMMVTLRVARLEETADRASKNIKIAIEIFKQRC